MKQIFTDWLKTRDFDELGKAFTEYLQETGIYQGEDYTNINDTYSMPKQPKEDRWNGFPPLIGDL